MAEPTDAQRLVDTSDMLIGAVENGPWALITDPNLRQIVGEYVADTCHSVALAAGLDEAMEYAHNSVPQRLDTVSRLVAPDARERLARHLHMQSVATLDECRAHADELLAVITGKGN